MSYLTYPRLHFAGKFQADPSTVNNNADNYDNEKFQADYRQLKGTAGEAWNPTGTGSWRFSGCVITAVDYTDGTSANDPAMDPIIGLTLTNTNFKVAGKLVDLDPQQQMVTELWGFQLSLVGNDLTGGFTGDFHVTAFADAWIRRPGPQSNSNYGAFYQSVLIIRDWANPGTSRYLNELASQYKNNRPDELSIKFNVDGHNSDNTTPDFTFGRVVGSIGCQRKNEPRHFVKGRRIIAGKSKMNNAYAVVEKDILHLDLGNSLPTSSPGGSLLDIGTVAVRLSMKSVGAVTIGTINYRGDSWYRETAGLTSFKLNKDQLKLASSNPISVVAVSAGDEQSELLEDHDGIFVRPDQFVFRLNPGEEKSTIFHALKFGVPIPNETISLLLDSSALDGTWFQLGEPKSGLSFPSTIETDEHGKAQLFLKANDPGRPRDYIDGQLYGVGYQIGKTQPKPGDTNLPISALVFSGYKSPAEPDWITDAEPIFRQYANLYPVMKPIVDLGNFSSVLQKNYILKNVFSMNVDDPNYMPVTRDLSEAKREMIRKWLDNPIYMNLDSPEDLRQALQQAIELEHSTIPPYLTALYSVKPGLNREIVSLIRSIVLEEMLHMALVSNILIAIGGSPKIGHPQFVPAYPTSLPGGLRFGLTVRLRKCSIEHIRECFMAIEEPEKSIVIKRNQLRPESLRLNSKYTIGWFYDEIIVALQKLHADHQITFGNIDKQVQEWSGTGTLFPITSLEDAIKAIKEIKEQGEGTNTDPEDQDQELAHYYKFSEIVEGRHLVKKDNAYSYIGAPIAFEEDAVWPMIDDPHASKYEKGSKAQILNTQFNQTYASLLGALHKTFNGNPAYLKEAVGVMFSLETIALQLVKTPLGDGTTAGPTFQIL